MATAEINLFHLLVVAPLLGYLSYAGLYNIPKQPWMYWLLAALVVGIVWFHGQAYAQKTGMLNTSAGALIGADNPTIRRIRLPSSMSSIIDVAVYLASQKMALANMASWSWNDPPEPGWTAEGVVANSSEWAWVDDTALMPKKGSMYYAESKEPINVIYNSEGDLVSDPSSIRAVEFMFINQYSRWYVFDYYTGMRIGTHTTSDPLYGEVLYIMSKAEMMDKSRVPASFSISADDWLWLSGPITAYKMPNSDQRILSNDGNYQNIKVRW